MRTMIAILLLTGLASCETASPPALKPGQQSTVSNDAQFIVHWSTRPAEIPVNAFFEVDVELFSPSGSPLTNVTLDVDAAMPQHHHGMNHRSHMEQLGPGQWKAEDMLFHMPGAWVLYFDIERDGAVQRAQTRIEVD